MTSYQRENETSYDGVQEPIYNALSYTWGRFENAHGSNVDIQGIKWEVPKIDVHHFTAPGFQALLRSLTEPSQSGNHANESVSEMGGPGFGTGDEDGVDFVWLDVACIDQRDSLESRIEKLEEINKQAIIFGRAEKTYVWLSHHRSPDLARVLLELGRSAKELEKDLRSRFAQSDTINGELSLKWLDSTSAIVEELLSDPWFTSLWTLQEAFLRQDALLLSQEAQLVLLDSGTRSLLEDLIRQRANTVGRSDYDIHESATCGTYWTVSTLAATLSLLHRLLLSWLLSENVTTPDDCLHSKAWTLFNSIKRSSLCYFDTTNEFALYHATKSRRPQIKFDIVYGCMQIFNVHLGKPNRLFMDSESLEELNDELVIWLVNRHGSSSQMFIHNAPAAPGKSWRFSLDSEVTDDFMPSMFRSHEMYMKLWVAHTNSWGLRFNGIAYGFASLAKRWSAPVVRYPRVSELEASLFLDMPSVGPLRSLAVDESIHLEGLPSHLKGTFLRSSDRAELVAWLIQHLAENNDLRVILLGHFMDSLWSSDENPIFYCMGIIFMLKHNLEHGYYWQRLGLCLWESNFLPLRGECRVGQWEHIEGLYG